MDVPTHAQRNARDHHLQTSKHSQKKGERRTTKVLNAARAMMVTSEAYEPGSENAPLRPGLTMQRFESGGEHFLWHAVSMHRPASRSDICVCVVLCLRQYKLPRDVLRYLVSWLDFDRIIVFGGIALDVCQLRDARHESLVHRALIYPS